MARRRTLPPLRTRGAAWGRRRVELGIPMRDLEKRSGVNRAVLSQVEGGRMIPTSEEFDAVMRVLREQEAMLAAAAVPGGQSQASSE